MPSATSNGTTAKGFDALDGPTLKAWRIAHGLNQDQLATMLDVPMNTIARWERGEVGIRHPRIVALALQALDLSLKVSALT